MLTLGPQYDSNGDGVADVAVQADTAADAVKQVISGQYAVTFVQCGPSGSTAHTYTYTFPDAGTGHNKPYQIDLDTDPATGSADGSIGVQANFADPQADPQTFNWNDARWGVSAHVQTVGVSVTDSQVVEQTDSGSGLGPPQPETLVFHRSITTGPLTVAWKVDAANTTATNDEYDKTSGTATFADGSDTAYDTITPVPNNKVEGDKVVTVQLSNPQSQDPQQQYVSDGSEAPFTITDTDTTPVITIAATAEGSEDPDPANPDAGPKPVEFTVSRTANYYGYYGGDLTVALHVSGGTADASDYEEPGRAVTIPAGQSSSVNRIVPIQDNIIEGDESVEVSLDPSNAVNAYGFENDAAPPKAAGNIKDTSFRITGEVLTFTNSQTVLNDSGEVPSVCGPFSQWEDLDGDGSPDYCTDPARRSMGYPVSFPAGAADNGAHIMIHVMMQAESGTPGALPAGTYQIAGFDVTPGGGIASLNAFYQGAATVSGTTLTADVQSDGAVPNKILSRDMDISWVVKRTIPGTAQDVGVNAPTSKNHLYLTGAVVPPEGALETVLDVGCKAANGIQPSDKLAVLDRIWDTFATRNVAAADGTAMKYNHDAGNSPTTGFLVANDKGPCGAWAHFLRDVLVAQGVPAQAMAITPPATNAGTALIEVDDAPAQGSGAANYHPADQPPFRSGNFHDVTYFDGHAVVESNLRPGYVYDPSYGRVDHTSDGSDPSKLWEAKHLVGVVYVHQEDLIHNIVVDQEILHSEQDQLQCNWASY